MPAWGWIAIVAGAWLALSVALGFVLARTFGAIERTDEWASMPLTRATRASAATRVTASSRRPS